MQDLKSNTNKETKNTKTDFKIQRTDWWLLKMGRVTGETKWVKGIKKYKLPIIN